MWTRLLIFGVMMNAVAGQLLLKRAIVSLGGPPPSVRFVPKFVLEAAQSPWIYGSLAIQALGYILWMILVSKVKLSVATASVGAGFYVVMALCAWWIYGESISTLQWLGIGLITVGVTCVSLGPA